jgi:hypothetical protein
MSYSFNEPDPHAFETECDAHCGNAGELTYRGRPWCGHHVCRLEILLGRAQRRSMRLLSSSLNGSTELPSLWRTSPERLLTPLPKGGEIDRSRDE